MSIPWAKNAEFYAANIYSSSGYSKTNANNTLTKNRGIFGTSSSNRYKVEINDSENWYEENINIRFDK